METFDFTRSLPPTPAELGVLIGGALRAVARCDLADLARASSCFGREEDRQAAVTWLEPRFGTQPDPDLVVLANGTQSMVVLLLQALVRPGMRAVSECLSYGMLRQLAEIARVPITGLAIDDDGLCPIALDAACREGDVGAIYCNPTFHNPTAIVMSETRRREIATIARMHGIPIIEDDPIGLLYPGLPRPIAAFAPEITWFVATLTKTIAQGMRLAHVLAPTAAARAMVIEPMSRLSNWAPAPLMAAIATRMIERGTAQRLRAAIAKENRARETAAGALLPPGSFRRIAGSPHIWIPVPSGQSESLAAALAARGILGRTEAMFSVNDRRDLPSGVRLSLSSPCDIETVRQGLSLAAEVIAPWSPRQPLDPAREAATLKMEDRR